MQKILLLHHRANLISNERLSGSCLAWQNETLTLKFKGCDLIQERLFEILNLQVSIIQKPLL